MPLDNKKYTKRFFFSYRKCITCITVKISNRGRTHFTNREGRCFAIDEFITCNATHVVYLLWCLCGLFYIGRTKRLLRIQIAEHLTNIRNGFKKHSVSLHFREKDNRDPSLLQFCGIDCVFSSWRGSNRVRDISYEISYTTWLECRVGSKLLYTYFLIGRVYSFIHHF